MPYTNIMYDLSVIYEFLDNEIPTGKYPKYVIFTGVIRDLIRLQNSMTKKDLRKQCDFGDLFRCRSHYTVAFL